MDERGVNIDIVFRNGLKDYEVLPPADAWDKISPVIRKRQRPFILFRSAAVLAVALSLSFLAYRWSRDISAGEEQNIQAQNTESAITPSSIDAISLTAGGNRTGDVLLSDALVPARQPGVINTPGADFPVHGIPNPSLSGALPDKDPSIEGRSEILMISNPVINSPETDRGDLEMAKENVEQNKPGRWSLTALISPSYYSRISDGNNEAMAQLMTSEQPLISYSGGVALSYRVNKRFSVQSGLYYSSVGQELSGISSYSGFKKYEPAKSAGFSVITASGTVYTNNADVFLLDNNGDKVISNYSSNVIDPVKAELQYIDNSLRQNFSYLELPVIIRYKVMDKTLDINLIGGFSSNLLVNNEVSANNNGDRFQVGWTDGLNTITFSSSFGMGMEYNFSRKLSLNLEPTLRYYLNSFGEIPGLKIHPYSFGIFSGLSYRF